jgi:hypothetical protein
MLHRDNELNKLVIKLFDNLLCHATDRIGKLSVNFSILTMKRVFVHWTAPTGMFSVQRFSHFWSSTLGSVDSDTHK